MIPLLGARSLESSDPQTQKGGRGARDWEESEDSVFNGTELQCGKMRKSWRWTVAMAVQHRDCAPCP
jgi:hypothetical protein